MFKFLTLNNNYLVRAVSRRGLNGSINIVSDYNANEASTLLIGKTATCAEKLKTDVFGSAVVIGFYKYP